MQKPKNPGVVQEGKQMEDKGQREGRGQLAPFTTWQLNKLMRTVNPHYEFLTNTN